MKRTDEELINTPPDPSASAAYDTILARSCAVHAALYDARSFALYVKRYHPEVPAVHVEKLRWLVGYAEMVNPWTDCGACREAAAKVRP